MFTCVLFRHVDGRESFVVEFPMVPNEYYFTGGKTCTYVQTSEDSDLMARFAKRRAAELNWKGKVVRQHRRTLPGRRDYQVTGVPIR